MHTSQIRVGNMVVLGVFAVLPALHAQTPYSIVDLGVLAAGHSAQANGISTNGAYVAGRDVGSTYQAVTWSNGSIRGLSNLSGRNYANAYAVNDSGVAVGTSTTTAFGSGALPVIWNGGVGAPLPLPSGQTVGRAYSINAAGVAVGSVGADVSERGTIWRGGSGGTASVITATLANGSYLTTAYGVNNAGLVVGNGINPNNAAVNVGLVYDSITANMTSVGALGGDNGALAFGVSNNGNVVGSSMLNQGSGHPYIWSAALGIRAIPLAEGTSQGSASAVNDLGEAVGTDSSAYAIPFLYEDGKTYRLADLLPANSGWDLSTNTYASAEGISNNGTIVGTGLFNGSIHAYEMIPLPEPGTWAWMVAGLGAVGLAVRRRVPAPR